jgi:photosystem II stability/assembly factor-like uncharacterized protein
MGGEAVALLSRAPHAKGPWALVYGASPPQVRQQMPKEEKEEQEEHVYRAERSYGAFARVIRLPVSVDGGKATASFKNGLLTAH